MWSPARRPARGVGSDGRNSGRSDQRCIWRGVGPQGRGRGDGGVGNFNAVGGTASFILEGTQVPETTTTVSLGVALAGLVGLRWVVQRRGKMG